MPSLTIVCDPLDAVDTELSAALRTRAPADLAVTVVAVDDLSPAAIVGDVVLLAGGVDASAVVGALRDGGFRGPVAAVWPHAWPRELARFHDVYRAADAVILNDATYWDRLGRLPRTRAVGLAVELDDFTGGQPIDRRPERILLARDPRRRPGIGFDRWLDEEALWFLRDLGLPVGAPDHLTGVADLRDWLRSGSVVVCWDDDADSRRVLLAAAATGCAVVCTPEANVDGLIEDEVTGCLAGAAPADLRRAVERARQRPAAIAAALRERVSAWAWSRRAGEYFALLRELMPGAVVPAAPRPDLRDAVTVFVTTVGASSYAACRDHLAVQDCTFSVEVIEHLAPMSAAFQRMLDTCRTPFYVQVDEDMLLYPHAVRTLYEQALAAPPEVAVIVGCLLDAHLDSPLQGVKIFRHAVVARYPFVDNSGFEMAQLDRMRPDGFIHTVVPHAAEWRTSTVAGGLFGLHGTHWTPRTIFERYATYERARHTRPTNLRAVRKWVLLFLDRALTTGSELDLYALLGVLAGRLGADDADGAKDFRRYERLVGLAGARAFLEDLERKSR